MDIRVLFWTQRTQRMLLATSEISSESIPFENTLPISSTVRFTTQAVSQPCPGHLLLPSNVRVSSLRRVGTNVPALLDARSAGITIFGTNFRSHNQCLLDPVHEGQPCLSSTNEPSRGQMAICDTQSFTESPPPPNLDVWDGSWFSGFVSFFGMLCPSP